MNSSNREDQWDSRGNETVIATNRHTHRSGDFAVFSEVLQSEQEGSLVASAELMVRSEGKGDKGDTFVTLKSLMKPIDEEENVVVVEERLMELGEALHAVLQLV